MIRKLVWYWICTRIAKQMWGERKWWFRPKPMTMKRIDKILQEFYIKPMKEWLNTPLEVFMQSTYNVDRGNYVN